MARLPRLALPGFAHLVLLRGHNGEAVFRDEDDRATFLDALAAAFKRERVALHAYALLADRVWLLCTPARDGDLSRAMQALGRRFAAAFNRRHDRSGSLWDGRYRSTVVEPGPMLLTALIFVEQSRDAPTSVDAEGVASTLSSSMGQHLGFGGRVQLVDLAEYWALGNTPFDRAAAFRALLWDNSRVAGFERMVLATQRGWPIGSSGFISQLEALTTRPVRARPRGRPSKTKKKSERTL
jgi:putative transposase